MAGQTNGDTRRKLVIPASAMRRVLDNAMLEMERMDGGEQMAPSKDEAGEYGQPLTGEGMQHIHIHLNESSAPAGQTGALGVDRAQDEFPSGPEFPEDPDAGNEYQRMSSHDDPYEARFQAIEGTLAAILQHLQGAGEADGAPADFGHGEPDGDEPGSAAQAPGNSPRAPEQIQDAEAEELSEEMEAAGSPMTKDAARKVRDSSKLEVSYQALRSDCEILVPGFRLSTFDAAAHPVDTIYAMCGARKKALDMAYMTAEGKQAIDTVMRGRSFDSHTMDCKCIRKTFDAAVAVRASMNNAPAPADQLFSAHQPQGYGVMVSPKIQTGDDLNNLYKNHYGRK